MAAGTCVASVRTQKSGMLAFERARGVFETNIISVVSCVEAFIQDCMFAAIKAHPEKLSLIAGKSGFTWIFISSMTTATISWRCLSHCDART